MIITKVMGTFMLVLLVVVALLLAINGSLSLNNMKAARVYAEVAKTKSELQSISSALESYYQNYQSLPPTLVNLTTPVAFINILLSDPFDSKYYGYVEVGGNKWVLYGAGPDGDRNMYHNVPTAVLPYYQYDPTNGLKSAGDIILTPSD